jgi:SAM-dependent methyltransferase
MTAMTTQPFNRILTDDDRWLYQGIIDEMAIHTPEMISRKISSALVQQAFVVNTVRELVHVNNYILSVGAYEDTAGELLKKEYLVLDIDPVINVDLHTYRQKLPAQYDAIIATSVLEHTTNDEEFIDDICALLKPGGVAVLTCDFKNDYIIGDRLPTTSNRFYTQEDLLNRLWAVILRNGCYLIDAPDYTEKDTFSWEGIPYSFATYVFRKDY